MDSQFDSNRRGVWRAYGAEFSFKCDATAKLAAIIYISIMESSLLQNKILIVEDDPDIGRIAQLVLEKAEYSVRLANHAERAVE